MWRIKFNCALIPAASFLILFLLQNCSGESGICSWYGAPGEIPEGWPTGCQGHKFHRMAMAAAHKTLPCGTKVRVTNLQNKKSVVVVVNDRGPFTPGRILDLTYAAAKHLDFIDKGVVQCKVEKA